MHFFFVHVAQEDYFDWGLVGAVRVWGTAQDQLRHHNADQAPNDNPESIAPDGRTLILSQVDYHRATERRHKRTQQVRLRITVTREHIGVIGGRQHQKPLVEKGGAEEQAEVVDEAEDDVGHETDDDGGHRHVFTVEPGVEGGRRAHLPSLGEPADYSEAYEQSQRYQAKLICSGEGFIRLIHVSYNCYYSCNYDCDY